MMKDWADADDRLLALSLFGTADAEAARAMILAWLAAQGFGPASLGTIELSVGAGVTVCLDDGARRIFVKVWPGGADPRSLAAQMEVQAAMASRGYPAPPVLTRLSALGPGWAVAMAYDRTGAPTDVRVPGVRDAMAAGLARLVAEADPCRGVDGLPRRSLPRDGAIWPRPHSALFDFEATAAGAEWIDEAAGRALSVMRAADSVAVVGHCDWSAKNMRMGPDGVAVVYDWDSVFLERETFVVGSAAAHFPVTWELDVPETPAFEETHAFVRGYERARGLAFTRSELAEVAAAVTFARAYKARCEHAIDPQAARWRGSSRESLERDGPFRFA